MLPFAIGIFLLFNSLGDKVWARNLKAAAWLRFAGNIAAFLGMVAVLADLYLARNWSWLIFLTTAFVIGLALFWLFTSSSRESTSD
jgi:energy-coupling factor transporter transmembrane protein EcfT